MERISGQPCDLFKSLCDDGHHLQMTAAQDYNFPATILKEAFQPSQPFDLEKVEGAQG